MSKFEDDKDKEPSNVQTVSEFNFICFQYEFQAKFLCSVYQQDLADIIVVFPWE